MGLELAPLAHQLFKVGVASFGQHDPHCGEQIAFALFGREALAFEAEDAPGTGAGRDRKLDCAIERRHAHLGTEYRLVERDRELETQIGTAARKQRMRSSGDRDQKIARTAAGAGEPLPFQADDLSLVQSGRDLHVDLATGRQLHALVRSLGRFRQRDRERSTDVLTGAMLLLEAEAAAGLPCSPDAPERFLQNIFETAEASIAATHVLITMSPS